VHDATLEATSISDLRAGMRVSGASIAWTMAASSTAVVAGVRAGSIVLVAFGLTGLLDGAGSATLVAHFRHALRHEAFSEKHERLALRIVVAGLVVVGMLTAIESGCRLATRAQARSTPVGVAVAACSVGVLALLSCRKHQIARRIPSHALDADAWLSATGCLLAVVTVVGTGLTASLGWWWVDPIAALGVALAAIVIAVVTRRAETRSS
jgi:divalent metal cation (Fe/Co/Zn/Cd) transporter